MTKLEFLAKWKRTRARWYVTKRGFIRCPMGLCPLQVMTGSQKHYHTQAIKKLGMSRALVSRIISAADHVSCFFGTPTDRLRTQMLDAKGLR